jgi:flagellar motor switch protein FliG
MITSSATTERDGGERPGVAVEIQGSLDSSARGMAPVAAQIAPLRKAAIVLVSLEQSLASQLLAQLDRSSVEAVTWEIARLDRIDPDEQAAVLEEFLGLGLRRLCFAFEDLLRLPEKDIRGAYHDEDIATWALALAGAAPPVRAKVFRALDGAAAAALGRFLEGLGPFRLSDAEVAQSEIAERFRRLHDRGSISLPDPSGREEVLV